MKAMLKSKTVFTNEQQGREVQAVGTHLNKCITNYTDKSLVWRWLRAVDGHKRGWIQVDMLVVVT